MQYLMILINDLVSHYIIDLIGQLKLFDSHYKIVLQSFFLEAIIYRRASCQIKLSFLNVKQITVM